MKKILRVSIIMVFMLALGSAAQATPITFTTACPPDGPCDYDNTANTVTGPPPSGTPIVTHNKQTTGLFRDVFWWSINNNAPRVDSPDFINQGKSLKLTGNHAAPDPLSQYTALNFTGPSISGGQSYLSIFDTTPGATTLYGGVLGALTKNTFDASLPGGLEVSADVLFVKHNVSAGVVALYNEGQDGLALLANNRDGNNTDNKKVSLIFQSPGQGIELASVSIPSNSLCTATDGGAEATCTPGDHWYRVVMDLTVNSGAGTFDVGGKFYTHLTPADPTSDLDSLITTLNFTGSLLNSDPSLLQLTNPGEIGVMAMGNESISLPDNVGVSITNFNFDGGTSVQEPAPLLLLGSGLVGLAGFMRKFKK